MAGGKQSARQKMINLMYLVFIAMIAMTMTKEVLSAFGSMDKKFVETNALTSKSNENMLKNLEQKAIDNPKEFTVASEQAKKIKRISDDFYAYLESLKADIVKGGGYELDENGLLPFEEMDKGDYIDEKWFNGDGLSKVGKSVFDRITKYKTDIIGVLGNDVAYQAMIESLDKRFDLSDIKPKEGKSINYLDYNFKGFPAIASHAKLTAMQSDVKSAESSLYNTFLGNTVDEITSLKSYAAIVVADKSAYFAGEKFSGKVVIGKYSTVRPESLEINGRKVDLTSAESVDTTGAARINFSVGNVGEQKYKGNFTFLENNEKIQIPFEGNYVVVPRPNSATISADKMNVVYRGVRNPMTISFAGVPDNKVSASAAGLSKGSGAGKYNMVPTSGREVTINVSATLDDGSKASDKKTFRIKDIPKPVGQIAGQAGTAKLPRNNVEIGKIQAVLEDFDFDLPLTVTGFKFKVPGQPSVSVSGSRLNGAAKSALRKAKRGATIQIIDIKSKSSGPRIKPATPLVIELTN